jgi:glycosyltransferase involved in cell wall biosynthesis
VHILFVHKDYPAQFGLIARYLAQKMGYECTYLTAIPAPGPGSVDVMVSPWGPASSAPSVRTVDGVRLIQYPLRSGATGHSHYCSEIFENAVAHSLSAYETLKAHPEIKPDLIVGHSGFGSTLFLADLYACPILNYFEYFYCPGQSYIDFRPDYPPRDFDFLRARASNAMTLLDLQTCTAGYSPTEWQRNTFPEEYRYKITTIFDGIDRDFWYRRSTSRRIGNFPPLPPDSRIVTYVARGLESVRGFDIFMQVAKRIGAVRPNVFFIVVGSDHIVYGADRQHIQARSFREHVLAKDHYDLKHFLFTGHIPPAQLVQILSLSDLHIYLTAPFLVGWSLFNALACGCTVLASDVAPVREIIQHEHNGLLADFFDVDGLTRLALRVLDDPQQFHPLGQAGVRLIDEKYSLAKNLPEMVDLCCRTVADTKPRM